MVFLHSNSFNVLHCSTFKVFTIRGLIKGIFFVRVLCVYGLCIGTQIRNQTDGILCSPEKIIFTVFTFSPGEMSCFLTITFYMCFVYGSCIWGISEKMWSVDRYGLRLVCIWFVYRTQESKINLLCPMFSWRNYFGENFRLFDFVRVSCIGQKSEDPVDAWRPFPSKSSVVLCFECVYARDVPEDFLTLYIYLI